MVSGCLTLQIYGKIANYSHFDPFFKWLDPFFNVLYINVC